jgi:AraC family ethanolamine operon transcriptional activator
MAQRDDKALKHPEVVRSLQQSLTFSMASCLTAGRVQTHSLGWHRHREIMRRFKEYLGANIERSVHFPEICAALNVSARTLSRCCADHLGVSPMQYLRLRRMNLARKELKRSHFPGAVTKAAMKFGFWHLGRFAEEYRFLFGETPSRSELGNSNSAGNLNL